MSKPFIEVCLQSEELQTDFKNTRHLARIFQKCLNYYTIRFPYKAGKTLVAIKWVPLYVLGKIWYLRNNIIIAMCFDVCGGRFLQ